MEKARNSAKKKKDLINCDQKHPFNNWARKYGKFRVDFSNLVIIFFFIPLHFYINKHSLWLYPYQFETLYIFSPLNSPRLSCFMLITYSIIRKNCKKTTSSLFESHWRTEYTLCEFDFDHTIVIISSVSHKFTVEL